MIIGVRGCVLTLNARDDYVRDGLVLIDSERGVIIDVAEYRKGLERRPELVIGGEDYLVTPGLVNTHTHIPMHLFKNIPIRETGFRWLSKVWKMESCLKPRHVYYGALAGVLELVKSGVTLFGDMYFFEDEVARASQEVGVRASLSLGVIELFEGPPHHSIEESIQFAERCRGHELVRGLIGVHALYSVTPNSVRKASEVAVEKGLRIHMHFAESLDEVRYTRGRYGTTPAKLAQELGLLSSKPLLAHAVYLDDEDIALLARCRPFISYCPFTIMSWGSGIARVVELLESGVDVTIGTDGPLTAGFMSPLFEMKVAIAVQSSRYGKPLAIEPYTLLKASIVSGARALGWGDVGVLERGYRADVVVWRAPYSVRHFDAHTAAFSLVYDFPLFKPEHVLVNGKVIASNGRPLTADVERIFRELEDARSELEGCAQ